MTTKHRWLVLMLAAALFASALAPASALAGRNDRSVDMPGGPGEDPNPMQYGEPDPGPGGSPQLSYWRNFELMLQAVGESLRIRLGLSTPAVVVPAPVNTTRPSSSLRGARQ